MLFIAMAVFILEKNNTTIAIFTQEGQIIYIFFANHYKFDNLKCTIFVLGI